MFSYKSPLQDDEFNEVYKQHERGYWPGPPPRPFPPRHPSSSRLRPGGPTPYSRPPPSHTENAPTYSSRYQLSSYPKELNDMFGAMECKLCSVEMTSPIGAKMHYAGKPHSKKVKNYLTEWSLKTGNPMPNFQQHTSLASVSTLADYCELCDVRLLTTNDKMLHYTGKTHQKNERDPANAKKKGKTYDTIDLSATDARFGIGVGFSSGSTALAVPENVQIKDFVCELCNVKAVSQEQLNIHLGGKKHQEKLRKKEAGLPKPERQYKCEYCKVALDTPFLYNLHLEGKPHAKVMKRLEEEYKGGGTCEICNVDFTSFKDYRVHLKGKKHEKKLKQNALRAPAEVIRDRKEAITCKNCEYIGSEEHVCDKSLDIKQEKPHGQWKCIPCYNMVFDTKEEYEEHKKTRRHLLCMLNIEGDKINEEKPHYYCFVCRKQCSDNKDYCAHLFSDKHMTLSEENVDLFIKPDLWHCRVCAIVMDQEAKEEHQKSKNHLLQAAQQDLTKQLTQLATEDLGTNTFRCNHCDINFINFVAFSEHMLDIKHLEDVVCNKLVKAGVKLE